MSAISARSRSPIGVETSIAVEELPGLRRIEHRRLARPGRVLRPAYGRRRIEGQAAAGRQPIEQHADGGQALLGRGRRLPCG